MHHPLRKPLITTGLLLACYGVFLGWSQVSALSRMAAFGDCPADEKLSVVLSLDFVPEAFHMTRLQEVAQVARVEGNTIFLKRVDRRDAQALARQYWVGGLWPWTESE